MRLLRFALLVAAGTLVAPAVAKAEQCPGFLNPPQYTYAGGTGALPEPPTLARADVSMKFAYLTISDPVFNDPPPHEDHTQGAVAVNNGWDYPPPHVNYASVEAGIGVFAHRRNQDGSPAFDRDGDGLNDPILWASHDPSGTGPDQFSFEGWAYPEVVYRFELIEVSPSNFRIWINGLESNLTWYGGWPPDQYPRGPRHLPVGGVPWPPYQMDVFGESNNHEDLICDEFDIGVTSISPPLTEFNYDSPWTFCFGPNVNPPWTRGEFWPSYRSQSYSSLCAQFGPFAGRLFKPRLSGR